MLAKDAASIPNALEATGLRLLVFELVTEPVEVPNFIASTNSDTVYPKSVVCCPLSVVTDS